MTTKQGGVPITGFMSTTDDIDTYATHLDNYGKGGIHSVQDLTERDAITEARRSEGMLCYILDDFALYELSGGVTNDDWLLIFSVVDGQVVINNNLPENYIYQGNKDGETVASRILWDVRLDLLRIRTARFILNKPNEKLLSSQVLSEMQSGYMCNDGGNIIIKDSIPANDITLSEGMVYIGDSSNMASEVQRLELDNLPSFLTANPLKLLGLYNLYTGSVLGATPTTTLNIQQCNLANLTIGKIWYGALVDPLTDPLNFGLNRPTEVDKLPTDFLEVPFNKVIIGNVVDRASAQDHIDTEHLPDLTFNNIWRGNMSNRPEESTSLTDLELKVDEIELAIEGLEAEIATIEGEIALLQGEMLAIQAELELAEIAIGVLQGEVAGLLATVAGISSQIADIGNATVFLKTASSAYSNGIAFDTIAAGVIKIDGSGNPSNDAGITSISTSTDKGGLYRTDTNTFTTREITGTANEIDVIYGDGVSGNPTIRIADNPMFPGTGSAKLPTGNNAQTTGGLGSVRYNSEFSYFEGCNTMVGSIPIWRTFVQLGSSASNGFLSRVSSNGYDTREITGTANEIDVINGDGVSGNPTIGIADNPTLTGNATVTGDLSVAGTILGRRTSGQMFWQNNGSLTAVTNGVWTPIVATTLTKNLNSFSSPSAGLLTYNGASAATFQFIVNLSFNCSTMSNVLTSVGIFLNGTTLITPYQPLTTGSAGQSSNITVVTTQLMNTSDYVLVCIRSSSGSLSFNSNFGSLVVTAI